MKIELNGTSEIITPNTSVLALVEGATGEPDPRGIAVALNGSVLRRQLWTTTVVNDGDKLEIVRALAGG
ncbi:MAG: sulfur carrier protein ThiS [Myxococcales bacterium]|nr:sulfur carrier protein ThiS [Myxococcales bacterium]